MSKMLLILPLALLMTAQVFSPLALENSTVGGLGNTNVFLVCTAQGCTTSTVNPVQLCQVNGVTPPILSIPIIGNIFSFFAGLGASVSGQQNFAKGCFSASSALFVFEYNINNPATIQYFLISILFIVLGTIVLGGISIAGTGINTGAIFVLMVGGALLLLWVVLSVNTVPTFQAIPFNIGAYIYFIMTLMYTIGVISSIGINVD